jgi:hypothetical protein
MYYWLVDDVVKIGPVSEPKLVARCSAMIGSIVILRTAKGI